MKLTSLHSIVFAACLLITSALSAATPVPEIVIAPHSGRHADLAAREIRRYFYLRCGTLLPIQTKADIAPDSGIVLLRKDSMLLPADLKSAVADFCEEDYLLKTSGTGNARVDWIVGGGDIGVLYGAYRFAEKLGVGGKMGATLALMLRRALNQIGRNDVIVTGVSRFTRPELRLVLEAEGVQTISCDLGEPDQVNELPQAENVLYLAGQKFGTDTSPELTWVQNTFVSALVARHFRKSRIVAFSTGCVYPFADVAGIGCNEQTPVAFIGEYASSCVGRERLFSHYARTFGTRLLLFRLNYAVELRYGVLVDIAMKVQRGEPIDVSTGWLNCIWQGDACARAIACLELTDNPPRVLNITGSEKLSVRKLAEEFGRKLECTPVIVGQEEPTAWLADASESMQLFGPPSLSIETIVSMVATYVRAEGPVLDKPTRFETRSGQF